MRTINSIEEIKIRAAAAKTCWTVHLSQAYQMCDRTAGSGHRGDARYVHCDGRLVARVGWCCTWRTGYTVVNECDDDDDDDGAGDGDGVS